MKYYHIYTQAEHNRDFPKPAEGMTFDIGEKLNPYSCRNKNSATRLAPGITSSEVTQSYISMLRELVFENIRLTKFPDLPSRKTCLWVTDSLESAKYWVERIPHNGSKVIYELELIEGNVHEAWEGHLTTNMENISELEQRAVLYWQGNPPASEQREKEILLQGKVVVVKEIQ